MRSVSCKVNYGNCFLLFCENERDIGFTFPMNNFKIQTNSRSITLTIENTFAFFMISLCHRF